MPVKRGVEENCIAEEKNYKIINFIKNAIYGTF